MRTLLWICMFTVVLSAETLHLNAIISHVRVYHPDYKAMEEESLALNAKVQAKYARQHSVLSLNGVNADSDGKDNTFEYSIGASTIIDLANTRGLELESADLQNEAILIYKQKELFAFGNELRNLYHQSCLEKEELKVLETTFNAFDKLYQKKQKAYKYQEISKKELLQLQLEKKLLKQKLNSQKRAYKISKEGLLNLTAIPNIANSQLECRDLYPISSTVEVENAPFILTNLAYKKEMESLQKKRKRFSRGLEPVEVSAAYDEETDTKRIGAGFSIPLTFTSAKNEQSRIYLLHKQQKQKLDHHSWLLKQNAKLKKIEAQLQNDYYKIKALKENIGTYKNKLMPLIEKSFQMGESSVIEYLVGRQKLLEISSELIQTKKSYYRKLFTLYTLIETEK